MYMFSDDIFSTTSDRMITELQHLLTSPQNTCWCLYGSTNYRRDEPATHNASSNYLKKIEKRTTIDDARMCIQLSIIFTAISSTHLLRF